MRQHLVAVQAAASISDAEVSGAELGSSELLFRPGAIRGGDYRFAIGSAGSTTLVCQTILLPLLLGASQLSTITFEGGTHNPASPPFDFLERVYLPLLGRMGARVEVALVRHGFYPAGGGEWSAIIRPVERLQRLELLQRGTIRAQNARALCAAIPGSVGVRQVEALATALAWDRASCRPHMVQDTRGPGNVLLARVESEHITELITGFGERGVPAERVAASVAEQVRRYLAAEVPVGEHLADQLLLPMALGSGGLFRTLEPSLHCKTQLRLLELFLAVQATAVQERPDVWRLEVAPSPR
jgi:RNA 3'-terminal phosphate cyclase (ATP)